MSRLSTALVVGLGSIGRRHAQTLRDLGIGKIGAFDPSAGTAARAAGVCDTTYESLDEALADRPDVVIVATPTAQHLTTARKALEAGAHVFIEKPLAADLAGVNEFVRFAASRPKQVSFVACNMRFHPAVKMLRELQTEIGPVWHYRSWFSHYLPNWRPGADYRTTYNAKSAEGGGALREAVHEIDALQWLAGPVATVSAATSHVSPLEIDAEDTADLWLGFAGGAAGSVHVDFLRPEKSRGCEIVGERGILSWTSSGKAPEHILVKQFSSVTGQWTSRLDRVGFDADEMYRSHMSHFLACVDGTERPGLDVAGAARILEIVDAARECATGVKGMA